MRERRALDADRFVRRPWAWPRAAATGYVVTVLWLIGATLLGVQLATHGVHAQRVDRGRHRDARAEPALVPARGRPGAGHGA